jgi:hypothetical protein
VASFNVGEAPRRSTLSLDAIPEKERCGVHRPGREQLEQRGAHHSASVGCHFGSRCKVSLFIEADELRFDVTHGRRFGVTAALWNFAKVSIVVVFDEAAGDPAVRCYRG